MSLFNLSNWSSKQTRPVAKSDDSFMDGASPLSPPSFLSLPHTTYSSNNLVSNSFSAGTSKAESNRHIIPLSESLPTCPKVCLSTPLPISSIDKRQLPEKSIKWNDPGSSFRCNSGYGADDEFRTNVSPFQSLAHTGMLLNNVPMFSEESSELWFKVLEAAFDEQQIFSELTRFRIALVKLKPCHLEVVAELLHRDIPEPYSAMKEQLISNFGTSDQERYVKITKMKLGNDKPSVLLRKMKSLFYAKPLNVVLLNFCVVFAL